MSQFDHFLNRNYSEQFLGITIDSLIITISKAAVKGFLSKFILFYGTLHTRLSPGEIQDGYCVVSAVVAVLSFSW